jgi:hypothetical protein
MSFILDALKRAEQKDRWRKAPKVSTVEPPFESPGWEVKMVSPARFERVRAGEGDAAEQKGRTDLHSSGRPSLRPGTPGGSEEPTQAYLGVRRGERRSDNEGIHLNANRYEKEIE